MKKEISIHLVSSVVFFLCLTLINQWFTPQYAFLWMGVLIGTFLPDIDHMLYVLYLRPYELTSQRAKQFLGRRELVKAFDLLAMTRSERKYLVFHSILFQLVFLLLTYWVLSSSNSFFGQGLVLAFSLHLVVDQYIDLMKLDSLTNWFQQVEFKISKEKSMFYVVGVFLLIVFLGVIR